MMLSWEMCESILLMLFDYVVCVSCCSSMCIEDSHFGFFEILFHQPLIINNNNKVISIPDEAD